MDCNKEEAMRAKVLAEKKMESKDFVAAHKMALKVKQLYPNTENISQMLLICDVHCASTKKLLGGDMDWYGILQVERTADEGMIKKQFRKFALLLHPDKNKLAGAEGAFKLVGEAQRLLLDQEKRKLYDMRNGQASVRTQHYTTVVPNTVGTFWTACNFCQVRYQYRNEVMNRSICCQNCSHPFVAYDMTRVSATNFATPVFPQQQMNNTWKPEAHLNKVFGTGTSRAKPAQNRGNRVNRTNPRANTGKMSPKTAKKRARVHIDLSESEISDSASESEEEIESDSEEEIEDGDVQAEKNSRNREESIRRSSRHKQKVSYRENKSDDDIDEAVGDDDDGDVDLDVDDDRTSKRAKGKSSSGSSKEENGDKFKDGEEVEVSDEEECLPNGHKSTKNTFVITDDTDSGSEKDVSDPLVGYPDPEFSNFDEDRKPECFSEGQIWACYDDMGALPRFYARVEKVLSPGFKLKISWLEPDPDDENEKAWLSKNLPISCGKFQLQKTEVTDHLPMFSHAMTCPEGVGGDNSIVIHPRKAEIWAVFKNWDYKWSRDTVASSRRQFEYDFVVVLTNYFQSTGNYVALLTKVKGFVSLFCRSENIIEMLIPANEVFRFSHMVPSRKINADERVPRDSFELDPASLPLEIFSSRQKAVNGNSESSHVQVNSLESSEFPELEETESLEVSEPQFFNFVADKSEEKFQIGQIWALYSDEDEMPKYYAQIKKLKPSPAFSVHILWLNSSRFGDCLRWNDKDMLVGSGTFHCPKAPLIAYEFVAPFSHRVKVIETSNKKKEFKILPTEGEVWALYRNWKADLKLSDMKHCDYDIVEICGDLDSKIEVAVLERVPNYNYVFKLQTQGRSSVTKTVSHLELVKFSHQIPAFRLTNEKDGSLWGCWELDPAALPANILNKK